MDRKCAVPRLSILVCAAAFSCVPRSSPTASPAAGEAIDPSRFIDSIIRSMTLEEKLGQLTMVSGREGPVGPEITADMERDLRAGRTGSFLNVWGAETTRRVQRIAVEGSRVGIPLLFAQDVIHGWRTVFPVPLGESASFDPAAVERAARIAAIEATAHGIHWTFAPMVDIARDPRWGRVVEGAGEDPYLGSTLAAARVRGFQGDRSLASPPVQWDPNALVATPKHFAAYGGVEGGREYNNADVSERTLWEVHFPPFEAAVRAGAGALMAAFNDIGGVPAHGNRWLLQEVLRRRWGFQGLVVSDWAGVEELLPHGVANTKAEAAARAIDAGIDIEMATNLFRIELPGALGSGLASSSNIDTAVARVLRAKYALGLFQDPYRFSDTARERAVTLTQEHRSAARSMGREAIVLLKNDSLPDGSRALPLPAKARSIAVIGPLADDARAMLGSWSGAGRAHDAVTVLAGIRNNVGPLSQVLYSRGAPVDTADTSGFFEAERLARVADAVVLVLGERADMTGEGASRASLDLPGSQLALARAVRNAARVSNPAKPLVAVLVNGRPLAVPWLADSIPAILETWLLGIEHGNAVADVLFGRYNPAGRLPITFPRATGQVPLYYGHRPIGRPSPGTDLFSSRYADLSGTPLWPFGYGLSYTSFAHTNLRLSASSLPAGDSLLVSVDITNTGSRAGDEVAQLYLRDDAASVSTPVRRLRGFQRIALKPGEKRTMTFTLKPEDLALYDLRMRRVVEPGSFTVFVGGSSTARLQRQFRATGDTLVLAGPTPRLP